MNYAPTLAASEIEEWRAVEAIARQVPGWVAFRPKEATVPAPQPVQVVSTSALPTLQPLPVSMQLVADKSGQESIIRTVLPFFALVVGLPLLLWYVDRKKEQA